MQTFGTFLTLVTLSSSELLAEKGMYREKNLKGIHTAAVPTVQAVSPGEHALISCSSTALASCDHVMSCESIYPFYKIYLLTSLILSLSLHGQACKQVFLHHFLIFVGFWSEYEPCFFLFLFLKSGTP